MSKHLVTGITVMKMEIDGDKIDFTKLHVQMKIASVREGSGFSKGTGEKVFNIGKSQEGEKLSHLIFPCEFEIDFEQTTKGQEIVSFKPITAPSKAAA